MTATFFGPDKSNMAAAAAILDEIFGSLILSVLGVSDDFWPKIIFIFFFTWEKSKSSRPRPPPVTHFQTKHRGEQRLDGWMDFGDIAYEQPLGPPEGRKNCWAR